MSKVTPEQKAEIEAIAARVSEWARSPEGQAELEAALREVEDACEKLRKSQRVDWRSLHRPVSI
jgi:hypothetical protein